MLDVTLQPINQESRMRLAPPVAPPASVHGTHLALRITKDRARTAVWTLTRSTTGRTVTLVGTMHIGDPTYYRKLSSLLAGLAEAGAEVHVEGISRRDGECLSEWEEDRLAEAGTWDDAETAGAAVNLLRLESQSANLQLPDGTRNIDLSHAEILRRVGWANYRRLFHSKPAPRCEAGFGPAVRAVLRFELHHTRAIEGLQSLSHRHRRLNRVVIRERNGRAFAGATEALSRGDVVLVWGTDHLPGLARLFEGSGYRLRREEWFESCSI
jgi:hypothetical protein